MEIIHADLLHQALSGAGRRVKFILGDTAIVFFPETQQHRDIKSHGLSYEDEYKGNAAAGLLTSTGVEIRFHQAYSDERVRMIWLRLKVLPDFANANALRVIYQGREISA